MKTSIKGATLFFFKKIGGHKSFCGITDSPVLDFC